MIILALLSLLSLFVGIHALGKATRAESLFYSWIAAVLIECAAVFFYAWTLGGNS